MNENLRVFLDERCPMTGPETLEQIRVDVVCHADPYGSRRYVRILNGQRVAVLQVMLREGQVPKVANVYVPPEYRRQGHATYLARVVSQDLGPIAHSADLEPAALAWVLSLGENRDGGTLGRR
jgi:hypothetical protein